MTAVLQRVVVRPKADAPALYVDGRSYGTYFNAFPAAYWRRWTTVRTVVLRLSAVGTVSVFRSDATGRATLVEERAVDGQTEFSVELSGFDDGGWLWFDLDGDLAEGAWHSPEELPERTLMIGVTTFNRVDDCVGSLLALGADTEVMAKVSRVLVADQGTDKISGHAKFAEAAALLGDRLRVVEQDNLGGSGGFARAFTEFEKSDADHLLLLDDDIVLEPDSILRAHAFAAASAEPVIVGGQMLNLVSPTRLHSMGEVVDLERCVWTAAPGAVTDHDFAAASLRETPELHRRVDVTYNGWWMCLFPREVVRRTGLPLPLFLKWDDAEYGLRALEKGISTVTLPGAAVWHMPWTAKNDTDWPAYFLLRNRLVNAALHATGDVRRTLLLQGMWMTMRRLLSMQYSTVALELMAVEDFLAGPGRLPDLLRTGLGRVKAEQAGYPDAQLKASVEELPSPVHGPADTARLLAEGGHPARVLAYAARGLAHNLRPAPPSGAPQVLAEATDAPWFRLGTLDSAAVVNADGSAALRQRDPKVFRELSKRAAADYRRLIREWPALVDAYRSALPTLTSTDSWTEVLDRP
ncbi:glycosyltransferase [Actinokineospora sp.]|uniref:glycosyltransferase n=1 Tax=Actinokineospora sp. TaxID=1872133 RepID=UPI003D6B4BA0